MKNSPVYIIAEAGVNHNGSLALAKSMIHAAAEAGVNAIKFQTFSADALVTRKAAKANYQLQATSMKESQYDMLRRLELDEDAHCELIEMCQGCDITFMSTAFDISSINLLERLGNKVWKIPSGEITNLPYLGKIGSYGQDILLSTGMCNLSEIAAALSVLESSGTARKRITLLHCNTEYPTPMQDVNLRAMATLSSTFPGLKGVGYSDHTCGIEVPIAAVAMGAAVIEKHFTLDRNQPGPDHGASLEPDELMKMVQAIRNIEVALGNGVKKPSPSERKNIVVARKSIVALFDIRKGDIYTENNLTVKRPGDGISPMKWFEVLGQNAIRNFKEDELIEL